MNVVTPLNSVAKLENDRDWWRGAVIYQIYPRSFQDSDGDGVGDLKGITERLPHVASLGVDAIWISPFFTSPMKDFGYDISDYCDVDPLFGQLADFDALLSRAHALGIRVLIDLVLSHTSDQHAWFKESRASRDNAKANWYVWADARDDGTPPTNWLSIFGGPAWQWDTRREQYYLHNFLTSQPDLNYHEPAVQDAVLDVVRFWLDRGVDGFRLDTINYYFHDAELRNNPPLAPERRNASVAPKVNPYNHQEHIYSKNRPENQGFLKRLRALMDGYGARACVGEISDAQRGLEILAEYTAGGDRAHMCYAFEFLDAGRVTAQLVKTVFDKLDGYSPDAWACWAYSNHDVVRHGTRWGLSPAALRTYVTLLMALKGSACLYQGEELGLPEAELTLDQVRDPAGLEFWPEYKGRDGCRTPMAWTTDTGAGFSTATPWLPVPKAHLPSSVAAQEADATALLHHYRRAIALRRRFPALRNGTMDDLVADGDVLRFVRRGPAGDIFCAFNLGETPREILLPEGDWRPVGGEFGDAAMVSGSDVRLEPWQAFLATRA
ncbi:alpha-amylase family glycosyl hydrolase [Pleomorphomonas sp. NRK KF1]|uniref:alpha-amylase family glycosyl hydrolase n=1 Tax=Pleomorphomonas sp. NRK KF1 TaxID=2943000 RepID=UPI002044BC0E|nr:alpha-amylase family glycosyl hydrolase [Pleomorphomonas sp. NRK KF1]MCM5555338.1 alpha-amylase family glycosyl hydrolase [Pleomorphomonas sp. NRK KF1]